MLPLTQTGLMTGWRNTPPKTAMGRLESVASFGFTAQIGQLETFDCSNLPQTCN